MSIPYIEIAPRFSLIGVWPHELKPKPGVGNAESPDSSEFRKMDEVAYPTRIVAGADGDISPCGIRENVA